MPRYVRSAATGATYFFTARAARRGDDLFVRHVDVLRRAVRKTRRTYPFVIEEIVVLPDVIHTLWTLPEDDGDFSRRWRMLKSLFSRSVDGPAQTGTLRLRPGEKGLWQRRFWEHRIRDAEDLAAHRHMIFCAPVQAGLVNRPEAWPYSSIHRAIAQGNHVPDLRVGTAYRPVIPGRRTPPPYEVA
ncbi:MAG: transposase [Pseudomonadota bacterium]